jgi:hypothetical protein
MLSWVVIVSRYSRRTSLSFSPCSHSYFGTHPSPIPVRIAPFFSCTYGNQFCNPFVFKFIQEGGGGTPLLGVQTFKRVADPSPLCSSSYTLFSVMAFPHPFWNQSLAHSFHHNGGVPPLPPLFSALHCGLCVSALSSFPSSAILSRVGIRQSQIHSHPQPQGAPCSRFG